MRVTVSTLRALGRLRVLVDVGGCLGEDGEDDEEIHCDGCEVSVMNGSIVGGFDSFTYVRHDEA